MGMPGMGELIMIFFIILVVFGAGKIPKIARDVGAGIREFKKSVDEEEEKDKEKAKAKEENNS
jgi:sec-independent protein translocase protein TatA